MSYINVKDDQLADSLIVPSEENLPNWSSYCLSISFIRQLYSNLFEKCTNDHQRSIYKAIIYWPLADDIRDNAEVNSFL